MRKFFSFNRQRLPTLISLALALITVILYWPMGGHSFIVFDDQQYIIANPYIQNGINWQSVVWAFTTGYAENWHPITWLTHMVDYELYGLNPGGHHLTNLIFHAATTVLIFAWLYQLTGALWRCAIVAAFFAWHPLHVESVAWAAERKDVLCAFFWMLTLLAYTKYAREKSVMGYAAALVCFALALMAKPMAVTLPCVLLLIDFWPLNRMTPPSGTADRRVFCKRAGRLFAEKIPFFVLCAAASAVTYLVQLAGGAMWSLSSLPPQNRIANALLAYYRYVSKTFWPTDLAIIYPHPVHWSWLLVIGVAIVLSAWIGVFIWKSRQHPYLLMGWLWFLGTLVPTIGLVQVGSQSIADRYTYIPSIGLFIVIVWGAGDLVQNRPRFRKILPFLYASSLSACLLVTSIQLSYWKDSLRLFIHAVDVTANNFVALNCLGGALREIGRDQDSIAVYQESIRIEDHYPPSFYNLATALLKTGHPDEAFKQFDACVKLMPARQDLRFDYARELFQNGRFAAAQSQAEALLNLNPKYAEAFNLLGSILVSEGKQTNALAAFNTALKLKPDYAEPHLNLGLIAVEQKNFPAAIAHFAEAVRLVPDDPETHFNLGLAYLDNHKPAKAETEFTAQLRLAPREAKARYRMAQALQQQGKIPDAIYFYRATLAVSPNFSEAETALEAILTAHPELKPAP